MTWSPKKKALVFATALLFVSAALTVSAAASTGAALRPFLRGDDYGSERSPARGHFVALGIRLGELHDGNLTPVEGARVVVLRPSPEGAQVVDEKTTDSGGGAVFALRPGFYKVTAESQGRTGAFGIRALSEDTRLGVWFDEEGTANWVKGPHAAMEGRGDYAGLLVRVVERTPEGRQPVANATVEVYRIVDGSGARKLVKQEQTGPRGAASFLLPPGPYVVKVVSGNASGEQPVRLKSPIMLVAGIDGSTVHWWTGPPPSESPPPSVRPAGR